MSAQRDRIINIRIISNKKKAILLITESSNRWWKEVSQGQQDKKIVRFERFVDNPVDIAYYYIAAEFAII